MSDFTIHLVKDFDPRPFGRYRADGGRSGEVFREDHLKPAMDKHQHVVVDLSGYNYYGSSFLEEVFGGLVRAGFSRDELSGRLEIIHDQLPSIADEAREYINAASPEPGPGK